MIKSQYIFLSYLRFLWCSGSSLKLLKSVTSRISLNIIILLCILLLLTRTSHQTRDSSVTSPATESQSCLCLFCISWMNSWLLLLLLLCNKYKCPCFGRCYRYFVPKPILPVSIFLSLILCIDKNGKNGNLDQWIPFYLLNWVFPFLSAGISCDLSQDILSTDILFFSININDQFRRYIRIAW